jgi:anti-anti-sigma regulatory factor
MGSSANTTVALPAIVDLDALDGIRDRLLEAVEWGPVTVDAGAVERVSTNGLLMLLSAAETAEQQRFAFEIARPSPMLTIAISRLGLASRFAPLTRG